MRVTSERTDDHKKKDFEKKTFFEFLVHSKLDSLVLISKKKMQQVLQQMMIWLVRTFLKTQINFKGNCSRPFAILMT